MCVVVYEVCVCNLPRFILLIAIFVIILFINSYHRLACTMTP